jgi:hypothetical protein
MQVLWKGPSSYLNRYRLIVLNVPFVFCITTMGLLGWEWPWHWKDMIEALTVSAGHCAQPEVRRRLKHSEKSWDCFFHGLNHCWLFSDHFCKYTWRVDCWSKWTWLAEVHCALTVSSVAKIMMNCWYWSSLIIQRVRRSSMKWAHSLCCPLSLPLTEHLSSSHHPPHTL